MKLEKRMFSNRITPKQVELFETNKGAEAIKRIFHIANFPETEEEAADILGRKHFNFLADFITNLKEKYDEGVFLALELTSPEDRGEERDAFLAILGKYLYLTGAYYSYKDASELIYLERSFKEEAKEELENILLKQFLFIEVAGTSFSDNRDFEALRVILRKRLEAKLPTILVSDDKFLKLEWPPALMSLFGRAIIDKDNLLTFK